MVTIELSDMLCTCLGVEKEDLADSLAEMCRDYLLMAIKQGHEHPERVVENVELVKSIREMLLK